MSRVALVLAILLAVAAAAAAALIILPAPSKDAALLAIWIGEKSPLIVGLAVLGAVFALFALRPGTRLLAMLAVVLCLVALIVALIPPAQALRLAGEQRVNLNFKRYFGSTVDSEGPVTAEKVVRYTTVDGRPLGLDVYVPKTKATTPGPAILVIHGGGWSSGSKGDASRTSRWLAEQGFTVFDVEYRTGPVPIWKAAVGDVKCAIGWVKAHASSADWNIDPKRVTLLGRSAGGHLALLAAYTPGDAQLAPTCEAADTSVESVVAYYAPTDLVWGYQHPARPQVYDSSEKLRGLAGGPPESTGDLYRRLSPAERVTPTSPRTLLVHGGRDQFIAKQHVELLTDKLHKAEVRFETLIVPYAQHGFDFIFGGLSGQITEAVVLRFLNAAPPPAASPAPAEVAGEGGAAVEPDAGAGTATTPPTPAPKRAATESKPAQAK